MMSNMADMEEFKRKMVEIIEGESGESWVSIKSILDGEGEVYEDGKIVVPDDQLLMSYFEIVGNLRSLREEAYEVERKLDGLVGEETTSYSGDMDPECVEICNAINRLPGISTVESCCGHDSHPYRLWVDADAVEDIAPLVYWLDGCHIGHYGWKMNAYTDCCMMRARFMIEGPTGQQAYDEVADITKAINASIDGTGDDLDAGTESDDE